MSQTTDASQFIGELNGGAFQDQLGHIISTVAKGVVKHGKKGQVTIKLDIAQIGESSQVEIAHTLAYVEPTAKGKKSEDTTSKTPMHLNAGGDVTAFANHTKQLFETN